MSTCSRWDHTLHIPANIENRYSRKHREQSKPRAPARRKAHTETDHRMYDIIHTLLQHYFTKLAHGSSLEMRFHRRICMETLAMDYSVHLISIQFADRKPAWCDQLQKAWRGEEECVWLSV